jgi:hypothetical protein
MMKITRLLLLLMLYLGTCFLPLRADCAPIPAEVKNLVTFIFQADAAGDVVKDSSGKPVAMGTGFFVAVPGPAGSAFGYLVTAKHVLNESDGSYRKKIDIRLNTRGGDAEFIPVDLDKNGKSPIFEHPDSSVDIVVVPCVPDLAKYDYKALPDGAITTQDSFKTLNIAEGSDIFFTGLYTGYYGQHHNSPIIRFGRVAMLPEDKIHFEANKPAERLYMLETQSYPGNSGSPVFFFLGADRTPGSLVLGPPVICLAGVMKGFFGNISPIVFLKNTDASPIPVANQNSGIAAVTPSYFLHDILFSEPLKRFRALSAMPNNH